MFDVRPVNDTGDLDLEKIKKVGGFLAIESKKPVAKKSFSKSEPITLKQGSFYDIKKYQKETQEIEKALRRKFFEQQELKNRLRQSKIELQKKLEKSFRQKFFEQQELKEKLGQNRIELQKELEEARNGNNKIMQLGVSLNSNEVPIIYRIKHSPRDISEIKPKVNSKIQLKIQPDIQSEVQVGIRSEIKSDIFPSKEEFILDRDEWEEKDQRQMIEYFAEENKFSWKEFFSEFWEKLPKFKLLTLPAFPDSVNLQPKRTLFSFAMVSSFIFLAIFGVGFFKKSLEVKKSVLGTSQAAYANLVQAKNGIMKNNYNDSSFQFKEAYDNFDNISNELSSLGGIFVEGSRFLPYVSKLSSGKYLAEAGKNISRIGILSGEVMKVLEQIKNPLENTTGGEDSVSFLKIFKDSNKNSQEILSLIEDTRKDLDKVNVDDIPEEQRTQFVELKNKLPQMEGYVRGFLDNSQIFTDILGGNGPRKYLFLFQNNQEMRATGGFIGSYGVIDIFNGRINKFFIDGIFNPDGQLREKVVPPVPIQKISAAWSLHDSNWFPDFPVSAEKAIWFYEKTGGPTVDGIITMTPNVMKKLLEVSGPIDMPEYGVVIDKDNFLEKVQNEVEVEYDKELNQPKKILADLAPKILDVIFNSKKISSAVKTLDILMESLNEKQILLYSRNYEVEKKISEESWSGEVLSTDKDYLSVINSNINGFKTDGVVDEKIEHQTEIKSDGSIIDSVTITRKHNGGDSQYDWLNKVNANYMRVYVPRGSKLISAEGQTREFNSAPLDYTALKFKHDSQVEAEEESIKIDEESGTRVYEDANKTVFANWVYVSPKEEVMVKYSYLLPFRVFVNDSNKPADTYSILTQKQSGSLGSDFISSIIYPEKFDLTWRYPDDLISDSDDSSNETKKLRIETNLKKDKFIGIVFLNKEN